MYDFTYQKPADLAAASRLSQREDYKLIAGGMSLIPTLKLRLARYAGLVDLGAIADLRGIRHSDASLVIGAMTPHADVAASDEVQAAIPALAALAEGIGDPLVRNRGTLGGSIAHADPAADYPAGLLGLSATIVTERREIGCDGFFGGMFETALAPSEIVTSVRFPLPQRAAYVKFPQPASRFALVGVFVAQTQGAVRVAVTGAGPCAFRWSEAEHALAGRFHPNAIEGLALAPDGLNADIHASAEYRAHCVGVLTQRAVSRALSGEA